MSLTECTPRPSPPVKHRIASRLHAERDAFDTRKPVNNVDNRAPCLWSKAQACAELLRNHSCPRGALSASEIERRVGRPAPVRVTVVSILPGWSRSPREVPRLSACEPRRRIHAAALVAQAGRSPCPNAAPGKGCQREASLADSSLGDTQGRTAQFAVGLDFVEPAGGHVVHESTNAVAVRDERARLDASDRLADVVGGVWERLERERRPDPRVLLDLRLDRVV